VSWTTLCHGGWVEGHDFLIQQLFQLLSTDVVLMKVKLEEFGVEGRRDRFVVGIMVCFQIGVGEGLLNRNAFFWGQMLMS